MIVLDGGTHWQVVMQTDHGDLAGALAAAWGNERFARPRRHASLALAATRHDDGWAVWERWPQMADDGSRPLPFLEVHIHSHLVFYDAAITDVSLQDPYAGLLLAMHGAGLYRERYGTTPGLRNRWADDFHDEIEAFVERTEDSYAERIAAAGASEQERWVDYRLLQVMDRLSLYFSGFHKLADGEVLELGPVPLDYAGGETTLRIAPLDAFAPLTPRRVAIDPYPFAEPTARFELVRRVIEKRERTPDELRSELLGGSPERIALTVERGV